MFPDSDRAGDAPKVLAETDRLTIRLLTPGDLDELCELLSDEKVMGYYPAPLSREESAVWLHRALDAYARGDPNWWAVQQKETGKFIGQVGALYRCLDGEPAYLLGYMLRRASWGQGYAREAVRAVIGYAFERLGVPRIECPVRPENTRSVRLALVVGLHPDRTTQFHGLEHQVFIVEHPEWCSSQTD